MIESASISSFVRSLLMSLYYLIDSRDGGDFWCFSYCLIQGMRLYSLVRWRSFSVYFCCPLVWFSIIFQAYSALEGLYLAPKAVAADIFIRMNLWSDIAPRLKVIFPPSLMAIPEYSQNLSMV